MNNFLFLFLLFMIYSTVGYFVEIVACSLYSKKIIFSRGFLIGPYLPIYGTGVVLITIFLSKYRNDLLALFIMSCVFCTVLEYITSYIMEKLFNLRWWDYSEKKFHINGRVCLSNSILFGIGGLLIVEFFNPFIVKVISLLSPFWFYFTSISLLIIFLIDFLLTVKIMIKVKVNLSMIEEKDATEQIRKEIRKSLANFNFLTVRLLKSFPNMEKINGSEFSKLKNTINTIRKEKNNRKKK